jgi:chromosome segregation ATPase
VQAAGNNWLTALGRKIQAQNEILTDQLARLNTAATFDDPILAEAGGRSGPWSTSRAPAARGPAARSEALPLPRLMAQFKTENDTWQRLAAVSRKVAEEVERPVMEAYLKAESARADAQARLEEANKRVPNTRAWPPSLQTLQAESQEFRETELRWERVRREPARAISLVTAIGELAQRYQSLAERVARAVERFENEQNRVRALENEIATSLQMWQMLTRVHTDDPTAAGGIRQVIDNHTRELEDLKRRYLQGQLTYYQVEQELRGLLRRINNTDVPLDSGEVMDINGVIRSGRM